MNEPFILEVLKIVVPSIVTIFYVRRNAVKTRTVLSAAAEKAASKVTTEVATKVEESHTNIKRGMGELMEVTKEVGKEAGKEQASREARRVSALKYEESIIYVYVIDDNSDDLYFIKRAIDKVGNISYKLYTDGDLFKERLPDEPHVYVVDDKLGPNKDTGLDISLIIKRRNRYNFIVGYTANSNDALKQRYYDIGVERFIVKSSSMDDSLDELTRCILEGVEQVKVRRWLAA